ncbi:hypothetical protein [Neobacillus sp. PS3-34]|uniref:hypothetical protein n=1 Tax=Neobacillus sp. PS3-34 TaxID=3070678 RepID=UPI0035A5F98F
MGTLLLVQGKAVLEKEIAESIYIYIEKETIREIGRLLSAKTSFRTLKKSFSQKNTLSFRDLLMFISMVLPVRIQWTRHLKP